MTWREIRADQNLQMAGKMLDQQGEITDLKAKLDSVEKLLAEVKRLVEVHDGCNTNCDLQGDLEELLG